jgi:hypothetical protein
MPTPIWENQAMPVAQARPMALHIQTIAKSRVDSFIDDLIMLDRWIPDEASWVRQIRESGEDDRCSITNLNTGLTKNCSWQNNHAILHGDTVFYNKKYVRTSKTKASITKPMILLCYESQ